MLPKLALLAPCLCLVLGAAGDPNKPIKIEPGLKNLSEEQKTAVQLAEKLIAEKKMSWTMPEKLLHLPPQTATDVGKGAQVYYVYYPTSPNEIKLLGNRTVAVNVATKQAKILPRD